MKPYSAGGMEEVLASHRDVAECAVIGVPDAKCGEVVKGQLKPWQCPAFGKECTPATPLGAPAQDRREGQPADKGTADRRQLRPGEERESHEGQQEQSGGRPGPDPARCSRLPVLPITRQPEHKA